MLECKSGTALSVWRQVPSLNKKFVGKIFVGDTSLSEKFSWMEANHENNEIKSTTKIFTYTVLNFIQYSNVFNNTLLYTPAVYTYHVAQNFGCKTWQ